MSFSLNENFKNGMEWFVTSVRTEPTFSTDLKFLLAIFTDGVFNVML